MSKIKKEPGQAPKQDYSSKTKELGQVYQFLKKETATATMAAVALNIYRPSLCRHKRTLEKAGHLFEIKKGTCSITGFTASYLTTDKRKIPAKSSIQLNLL